MKNLTTFNCLLAIFLCFAAIGCNKEGNMITVSPINLESCFSPEFGVSEKEQFFHSIQIGTLQTDISNGLTSTKLGYDILEGPNTIFIYKHFLENSFDIIDDEVEIRILFEIDESLSSFDLDSPEEFENANFIYAECGIALQKVTGTLSGEKKSNGDWKLKADLEIDRFTQIKEVKINDNFSF